MSFKPWIYYFIAPIGDAIDGLRDIAVQLGDGGEAERLSFSTPLALVDDPSSTVAYCGGTGPVSPEVSSFLETTILPFLAKNVVWYQVFNEPNPARVVRCSDILTQNEISSGAVVYWNLTNALKNNGMIIWNDPSIPLPNFHIS